MSKMWPLMPSLWKFLPAQLIHELAHAGLTTYAELTRPQEVLWKPFQWRGLSFGNRLGVAAGLDKNAELLETWKKLGAGFVEIGTVTPRPQTGNSGKVIDRDWTGKCLWNRMGFPSEGAKEVSLNLAARSSQFNLPIFCNIGKNRLTPASFAVDDYAEATLRLAHEADVLVVNVSSPNTVGLRDLQSKEHLRQIVSTVSNCSVDKPVLVKLSPDLSEENLYHSIDGSLAGGCAGFILTNTTVYRPAYCKFPSEGGLSGAALADFSKLSLTNTLKHLGSQRKDLLLVSVGGVLSPQDVQERLSLGADLVQVYSALVFNGPSFFRQVGEFFKEQDGSH